MSIGICWTPKLSKYATVVLFEYKAIQWVLISVPITARNDAVTMLPLAADKIIKDLSK